MSNGSRLRRDRTASRTHAPHAPHSFEAAGRAVLIPTSVAVATPRCGCAHHDPVVLPVLRCDGLGMQP